MLSVQAAHNRLTTVKLVPELGAGGFPRRRTAAHGGESPERQYCAGNSTARADSPAARARQHIMASVFVPTHQVCLDGVLPEHDRHLIVDMSGATSPCASTRFRASTSLFSSASSIMQFKMMPRNRSCKALAERLP